jgi:chromosome segregation protein
VFLKSLTLKGFKSFADATVLDLEPGVTVVVGPNGSGKSNVVDAIAWVLGAQAPSAVRSQKMDDVIFAGTAKRPALGRAEVTLTLDNSAGLLPLEVSEVSVSRTLFRTGESEYAINGVACRLLDVQELLSDAGVGRQQHVIVSQGQIDAVLNARPEDRRSIIEEAAGVLKYRKRKEKSERRLESTEASLLRVQDLLREVRRQLRPLERQADAARRHGDLVAELDALRIFLAGREVASFRSRLENLHGDRNLFQTREDELRRTLADLDTRILAAEAELTARGDSGLSDELVKVEQLRERARGISMLLVERRRSYERDRGHQMDAGVVANLEADAARLREELIEAAAATDRLEPEKAELAADEATFELERNAAVTLFDRTSASTSAASAAAEVRGELRSLRASVEAAESEVRRHQIRIEGLREREMRLESEVDRLRSECARAQEVEVPLVNEVTEARRLAAEGELERAVADRQAAQAESTRWQARSEALQLALDTARARAGAEQLQDVEGFIGTLLDLIEIDSGWESAVEAALGEALAAVVVESPDVARRALGRLRGSAASGAVIALGARADIVVAGLTPAGAQRVRDHVRSNRRDVSDLLDILLASAVRVSDWAAAVDAVMGDPRLVAVTPDGDRFTTTGWRIGSAGTGATAAALEDAVARAEAARGELERREAVVQRAQTESNVARQQEADVQKRLDSNDSTFTAASEALARAQGERREATNELEELRERSRRTEVEEAEVKLRLEGTVDMLRRELDIEPEVAEATEMPAVPEGVTHSARVRDLERELRLMGPINPLALEEFNELQERHVFLEEQLEDVRSTRRELMRVIAAIDAEIQSVFASAFADVSGNFSQLFAGLFPGGTGRLQLTNPDDLLNTGIEVEAKPGGKNVKKLSLLSGGERSLTALAFLFAVFRSRPSPFYVMDEVEAALDDVNLHRFLGLISEFRREAQLLIVSHQKRTMEAGDSLLGVSMQPGGSSKVVTERSAAVAGGGPG